MFIHYGSKRFYKNRFDKIMNCDRIINKPYGGLWACREESDDWKQWCEREDFLLDNLQKSFKFNIKEEAKWLVIESIEDFNKIEKYKLEDNLISGSSADYIVLDWEAIAKDYDVFELKYNWELRRFGFYSWDVSTVLVLNKDVIEKVI